MTPKTNKKKAVRNIPRNACFGCGQDNAEGMRLKFKFDEKKSVVRGAFRMASRYQGSRTALHGGIIALLVDEAMGKLNRLDEIVAPTAELRIEYLRPVPVGRKIVVESRRVAQAGRNYWRECTIRDGEGNLLARGRGRFVKVGDRVDGKERNPKFQIPNPK